MNLEDYTIEYCPWCDKEVAIHAHGITACPECGKPLAPCSVCWDAYGGCIEDLCPYGCGGAGSGADDEKEITEPAMTLEEIAFAFSHC